MPAPETVTETEESSTARASRFGRHWWPYLIGGWAFLILLYLVPHALTANLQISPAARLTLETQIRDSWAKILWAAITLMGAALIWRYLQKIAKVVENSSKTLAAAERTAFFAAQAGETERYARAMGLLGDDKIEVRLGGIYALERLARESSRDHGPIMEVLSAYIREHAAWQEGETAPARPRADMQAILTVLGRRHAAFDPSEGHIDLHGTALSRAYLPWAHLERAFLYEANLDGAMLQNANLRGAWLWKTSFNEAILEGARLEGADLTGAANLTAAQLRGAHIDATTKLPDHLRGEMEASPKMPKGKPKPAAPVIEDEDLKLPSVRQ
ncbi:pentapeptide repeat-containing protein [bacterium]|nr:MAG: pentapeptide repeat-containing protein [bacterium]